VLGCEMATLEKKTMKTIYFKFKNATLYGYMENYEPLGFGIIDER